MNAVWDNSRFGKTSVKSNTMVNTIQPYWGQSIPRSPEVTELNQNLFGLLVNLVPGYRRQNVDINHNSIVILTDKSIIVSTSRSTYFEIKTTLWSPIKSIKLHFLTCRTIDLIRNDLWYYNVIMFPWVGEWDFYGQILEKLSRNSMKWVLHARLLKQSHKFKM